MSTVFDNLSSIEIFERAKSVSEADNDAQLSVLMGVARTNMSTWKKRNFIPYENLFAFSLNHNVDFHWLITGEGKKITQVAESSATYDLKSEFITIPFYNVDVSAGNGGNEPNEEEFKPLIFRSDFFDDMGLNPKDLVGANVPGDSMQPLIPPNSGVLIDTTDQKMTDGKVYVFNADGNLLVKKIIVDFDGFIARSINTEYSDIQLSKDKIDSLIIVGRARLALPYIKL